MPLLVKRLRESAILPTRAHETDAGLDLYADIPEPIRIPPGERVLVPTGIAISLWPWTCGQIWPRSGMAVAFGVDTLAGIVDSGYRGEVKVALINHGHDRVTINSGDRIAQLVLVTIARDEVLEVSELPSADRRGNGFGSSGV
ncbi:dUTP diphosphatase [Candidatus Contendibacter odensensis]|uniref:dUTP diphosphatase n=1 Tax=Candidatus Contendobacter odensis Run_B_J11 TaxID=1400861 RepID=A0A7U7GEU9_9GAMM|nr:dUTP diphosphatase [Candidatus Contendobacter odensis]CDH46969.1 putative Deoxyuridine 5'-triphosphate nucleotidohydrolase [Candidatus Contendobacter odensis Run_B_J11]